MTNTTTSRETKALAAPSSHADTGSEAVLVSSMMEALSAYRDANDARLDALEKRSANDVLLDEKLHRIDLALDDTTERLNALSSQHKSALVQAQRPQLFGGEPLQTRSGHAQAFDAYLRTGACAPLNTKAMEAGTDADGGYLVPHEAETTITEQLTAMSPMRMIATVRQVSSTVFRKPVATDGFDAGWAAENAARPETGSVTLSEISFPTMELYAMPAATAALLDDSAVDMDMWIANEVDAAFAEQESQAFVSGNGTSQPLGFLTVPTVDETSWSWGNIGTIATGSDGTFPSI
ncbi:MAG: phage major capsid protein, partial [Pseudomonadota bacterium]